MLKEMLSSVKLNFELNSKGYARYTARTKVRIDPTQCPVGSTLELMLRIHMQTVSFDAIANVLTTWDPARVEYSYSPSRLFLTRTERGWYSGWHRKVLPTTETLPRPSKDDTCCEDIIVKGLTSPSKVSS